MMGGGDDLDEAFRWLCQKGQGGDFLVLRAHGKDDYNPYVSGLCRMNSVATLLIPSRKAAMDPKVAEIIRAAEVVFISGGDQARYIKWWTGTPVQEALNSHIAAGKPIGGTSAGLAVQGEFTFAALHDTAVSAKSLRNPFDRTVTVTRGFLRIPHLENTITDTHFVPRGRMGRTLVFLARIMQDGWSAAPRSVAVDEKSAVLLEPDGTGKVVGPGKGAYLIQATQKPEVCRAGQPLTLRKLAVFHAAAGATVNLATWTVQPGVSYELSVEAGSVRSTQAEGAIY